MATAQRVGPWFVLQRKNPTAPGLKHSVLLSLVRRGLITPESIVRGPTTQQLWRRASHTRGIARAFGVCWNCQASVNSEVVSCARCGSPQNPPDDPDVFLDGPTAPVMREIPSSMDANVDGGTDAINDGFESPRQVMQVPAASRKSRPRASRANLDPARSPEPIMSAKELAAVFQLQPSGLPARSRSTRFFRSLLTTSAAILLVGGTATAALLYAKPEWRAVVQDHALRYWNQIRTPDASGAASTDSVGTHDNATNSGTSTSGSDANADDSQNAAVTSSGTASGPATGAPISPSLADVVRSGAVSSTLIPASSGNAPDRSTESNGGASKPESNEVGRDPSSSTGPIDATALTADAEAKTIPTSTAPSAFEVSSAGATPASGTTPASESVAPAASVNGEAANANSVPERATTDAGPISSDKGLASSDASAVQAKAARAATDAGQVATDAPREVPIVPQGLDVETAVSVLRDLRVRASAFERDGDFLRAIACYEQMRKLPEEVRPTHIDTQIARLKRRAGIEE